MRKYFIIIFILALLIFPASAKAQSPITFESMDVSIWPEYDTSTALVIYKIALDPGVNLPTDVILRLPASVKELSAVAVGDAFDRVSDAGVIKTFTTSTDYSRINLTATGRFLQIEYYDPNLLKTGNQREFTYQWLGDYAVKNFSFEFRQPLQSTNVSVVPPLTNSTVDTDGFQLSSMTRTNLAPGQELSFVIKYQRETDSPSTAFLKVQPSAPLDQNLPGQSGWNSWLSDLTANAPWLLVGFGVICLLVAGYIYWTSKKGPERAGSSRKRHSVRALEVEEVGSSEVHCSQCGKLAKPGDRFCRTCGARIREI